MKGTLIADHLDRLPHERPHRPGQFRQHVGVSTNTVSTDSQKISVPCEHLVDGNVEASRSCEKRVDTHRGKKPAGVIAKRESGVR